MLHHHKLLLAVNEFTLIIDDVAYSVADMLMNNVNSQSGVLPTLFYLLHFFLVVIFLSYVRSPCIIGQFRNVLHCLSHE